MDHSHITASDLYELTECDRIVFLNHNGDTAQRAAPSAYQEWLKQEGRAFEAQVVSPMAASLPLYRLGDLPGGFAATLALMRGGARAIYQGVLLDGDMVGLPDILQRVEGPSNLGAYHYRPLDVKLASEAKPGHRWQVMFYAMLLERIQGVRPEGGLLLRLRPDERSDEQLYREEPVPFDADGFAGALAEVRRLTGGDEPRPFISSICGSCAWREVCVPIAEASHDVSLLPGLKRKVWAELHTRGMGTLAEVAAADPQDLLDIHGVGDKTARDLVARARALSAGTVVRIAPSPLPPPADAEIFFDVESVPSEGLYYLMGTLVVRGSSAEFVYDIAERREDERAMWDAFLSRMARTPGPVYHYGVYERTTVNALTARYGDDPRAAALLDRMVDLDRALKQSVVLPLRGYSLKDVAGWLGYAWSGETQHADDSMLEYLHWLETGDRQHLEHILHYNQDDVRATKVVRDWLATG